MLCLANKIDVRGFCEARFMDRNRFNREGNPGLLNMHKVIAEDAIRGALKRIPEDEGKAWLDISGYAGS